MMLTALLALGVVLNFNAGSAPHATLRSSDPPINGHVAKAPHRLTLWFTEKPQVPFSKIRLVGPAGDVALGKLVSDTGNALRVDIVGAMADASYKVVWQTGGSDGHTVNGEFSFAVGSAPLAASPASTVAAPATPVVRAPSVTSRAVRLWEFIGLLIVLGVIVFVHGVLPPLAARGVYTADVSQQARGLGEVAAVIYALSAAFRLIQQAASVRGGGDASMQSLTDIVARSSWGNGWVLGEVGAALVVIGFLLSIRRLRAGTPTALTGALAMTLSPALTGHAAAARLFIPSVTLDALHVASIGAWLGTLAVVVMVGIPAMARVKDGNPDAAVSALVNSFHPIALLAAPLAVFAGLGSSALRLGSVRALTNSHYGTVLITKLVGVVLVASFGAWNSMRARRRLGNPDATLGIRRTAAIEVALAVLVLWATTDLIATPSPMEMP
jgi:putative copper export protein/methionine-rich copper-binding protein CopC